MRSPKVKFYLRVFYLVAYGFCADAARPQPTSGAVMWKWQMLYWEDCKEEMLAAEQRETEINLKHNSSPTVRELNSELSVKKQDCSPLDLR
jgi:hypothetical protein